MIISLLLGRSMKVVVNDPSSEVDDSNAGLTEGYLLGPTFFLLYINDMLIKYIIIKYLCRWYNNIWIHLKNLDDQGLAADLSPDLELTAQFRKQCLVTLNTHISKIVTCYHHYPNSEFSPTIINSWPLVFNINRYVQVMGHVT